MEIDHKQILANRLASRFSRRRLMQGMGAGAAAAVLPSAASANGGHIKLAWIDFVDTLDPHFTGFLGAIKIHNNIYNGLLKITYDGEKVAFVPDLAESWKLLDDKTHLFKLHAGVKFHDGEPATPKPSNGASSGCGRASPSRRMPGSTNISKASRWSIR